MKFVLTCDVTPLAPFGLPDGDVLVVPGPSSQMSGPAFHWKAGVRVGYGSLSQYRGVESRLDLSLTYGMNHLRVVDNAFELTFEAQDPPSALAAGLQLIGRLLQHLALEHGTTFRAVPRILEDCGSGTLVPLPMVLFQGTVTVYDLDALRQQLEEAAKRSTVHDAVLGKALDYYEHALFLSTTVPTVIPLELHTAEHLVAGSFLFLWKALSSVVGDPSSDKDYQRRYRELGLDYSFFRDTIEEVRRLRNDEDVAHYRLDPGGLEVVKKKLRMAQAATRRVLVAYTDRLLSDHATAQ